jgi:hypothetical protein
MAAPRVDIYGNEQRCAGFAGGNSQVTSDSTLRALKAFGEQQVLKLEGEPFEEELEALHQRIPYLYAGILFFASMGAYAVNGSPFDLILLLALGLLGFVMPNPIAKP